MSLREAAARALYDHEMDDYQPDETNREAFWLDPDIRDFWLKRADVVIGVVRRTASQGVDALLT